MIIDDLFEQGLYKSLNKAYTSWQWTANNTDFKNLKFCQKFFKALLKEVDSRS